jgi:hypothetical protein
MDRKLLFDEEVKKRLLDEFLKIKNSLVEISFEVWNAIPEEFQESYFENEQLINPITEPFDIWREKLSKRNKTVYSVGIFENKVIASVCGSEISETRSMNLWVVNQKFRNMKIGEAVIVNYILYSFEKNSLITVWAWDITSKLVDDFLIKIGFE